MLTRYWGADPASTAWPHFVRSRVDNLYQSGHSVQSNSTWSNENGHPVDGQGGRMSSCARQDLNLWPSAPEADALSKLSYGRVSDVVDVAHLCVTARFGSLRRTSMYASVASSHVP